jgi:hypothetical protein
MSEQLVAARYVEGSINFVEMVMLVARYGLNPELDAIGERFGVPGWMTSMPERLLVIEGNRTYHRRLFERDAEMQELGTQPTVGIYVLRPGWFRNLQEHNFESLVDLRAWSLTNEFVETSAR